MNFVIYYFFLYKYDKTTSRIFVQGCHGMKVLVNPEAQDEVTFVSQWDSQEDFLAHVQGDTFKKHIPGMGAYYVSGTDMFLEEA